MDCMRRRGKVYNVVVTVPADLVEVVRQKTIMAVIEDKALRCSEVRSPADAAYC